MFSESYSHSQAHLSSRSSLTKQAGLYCSSGARKPTLAFWVYVRRRIGSSDVVWAIYVVSAPTIGIRPLDMCSTASCPLRTLHAVGVMGTRLCFYSVGTQDSDGKIITPIAIPDHPLKVIDNVPSDRWELDILEPAGEAQFREITQEIMDGCHALDA